MWMDRSLQVLFSTIISHLTKLSEEILDEIWSFSKNKLFEFLVCFFHQWRVGEFSICLSNSTAGLSVYVTVRLVQLNYIYSEF